MNRPIRSFRVTPTLPPRLEALRRISMNVWFCWNQEAVLLFHRIDPELWETANHNPVHFISMLKQEKIDDILHDEGFLSQMDRLDEAFQRYMSATRRYEFNQDRPADFQIAYFSAEYGLSECLPLYSGGLGILSGDHLKSASDLNLPLFGIGLLYQMGYFQQYLNNDGWQQERYEENAFHNMPVSRVKGEDGHQLRITVDMAGSPVQARIWKIQVGRVPLFLLDSNMPENPPEYRSITDQLYGGDTETRIRQEILLGIGGARAIEALKLNPSVYHMNEGHSAFASLERIRLLMEKHGLPFDAAREAVCCNNVFTTHTPVPAGYDMFPRPMMEKYFAGYSRLLGISFEELMALGRQHPADPSESFCMMVLALKLSAHANGVSRLHGDVSRKMWKEVWPNLPEIDIPITHVTNGIHIPSWISYEMATLYQRYLGPNWSTDPDNQRVWERVERIPDSELWRTHERRRERLVEFARRRLTTQLLRRGASKKEISLASEVLNPEALTIGFARRFATYKRGNLIFQDPQRLAAILNDPNRPVQLIIAGKAHPKDTPGKEIIRQIIHMIRREEFRRRVVFLEDYDMNVARYLVEGVDVWLNNPRRPLEACGTSGMKVTPNGGLNLSVLDGWWDEGYNGENGWAIGSGEEYDDQDYQNDVESEAIYSLLEKEVVPLYYDRGQDNLPRGWIHMMKCAMKTLNPLCNTHRMVEDYFDSFYVKAARSWKILAANNLKNASELSSWKRRIFENWAQVSVLSVDATPSGDIPLGSSMEVTAELSLGGLSPTDVRAEIYFGPVNAQSDFIERDTVPLSPAGETGPGRHRFTCSLPCRRTGKFAYTIRVTPSHALLGSPVAMNLVVWG